MRSLRWFHTISLKLRSLVLRRTVDEELDDELRDHLERKIEDYAAAGASREEARRRALIELGGVEQTKEKCRDARRINWIYDLAQDVRFGLRMLRKSPGFTAVAVLTLALGIGANTAIFSVVNAVLLRPLPYADSGELAFISDARPIAGISGQGLSYRTLTELRQHSSVFSTIAGFGGHALVLTGRGEPSELSTVVVTPDFFSVFAAKPLLGRSFNANDGRRGAAPVVILSENLWRSRFGGDPRIIGQPVTLDMRAYTVIGVMPASFHTPFIGQANQVWIPLAQDPLFSVWMTQPPREHWMPVVARLRPGISDTQAQPELDTIGARMAREIPNEKGWALRIEPLQQTITGGAKLPLLLLLGAVGLVLLIACANIANLLLTRALARSKEIAIRITLGARKRRIVRQLLTESALLGLLGGIIGILSAYWCISALRSLLPAGLPQIHPIRLDAGVLVFALVLSLIASLVFGIAPVILAAHSEPQKNLRDDSRTGEGRTSRRARSVLAAGEIALAMVLLVGAGLLMRSFAHLSSVNPGFDANHVVKAMVSLPQFKYSTPKQWAIFSNELMAGLEAQPGMHDSAMAGPLPIVDCCVTLSFRIDGNPPLPPGAADTANYVPASSRYFSVMRIPLLHGRLFDKSDASSAPPVTLISETLAKRYFPNEDPLGRHLTFGFPINGAVSREIVGIVGDVRDVSLGKKPGPMVYVPFAQAPLYGGEVVVRSNLSTSAVVTAIRAVTHKIDKYLPVTNIQTLPEVLSTSVSPDRFRTLLLGIFAAMALALAAIGIFGVISYSVTQRTHEIGVRMALGAEPKRVLRLVLGHGIKIALAGTVIGIAVALALTRLMSSLLFGISAADPLTFIGVAIVLIFVALLACYIPARRAMRVDPMTALRHE